MAEFGPGSEANGLLGRVYKDRWEAAKDAGQSSRRADTSQKARASGDYWDYATLMEPAVIARDRADAEEQASVALAKVPIAWHLDTSERNLRLIRAARGEDVSWVKSLEDALATRRTEMAPGQPAADATSGGAR
jgi:hypothetical protein